MSTLRLIFCDWTLHSDVIIALMLPWLQHHQHELLANPDKNKQGMRFDVDYLNVNAMDFVMDIDLTERVPCRRIEGSPGQVNLTHVDDYPPDHHHTAEKWRVMFEGKQIASGTCLHRTRCTMADDLQRLESWLAPLLHKLEPAQCRQLAREVARNVRKTNQQSMAAQQSPDGDAWEPRKPRARMPRASCGKALCFANCAMPST